MPAHSISDEELSSCVFFFIISVTVFLLTEANKAKFTSKSITVGPLFCFAVSASLELKKITPVLILFNIELSRAMTLTQGKTLKIQKIC